ncbi:MAG: arginine--tRNA ligase, partial [Thermodesulfobacteriota bacterium]
MRARVGELIDSTLAKALKEGLLKSTELPGVIVELSKRPEFGDYATNVAMLLASTEKRPPREIAELISGLLAKAPSIEKCEVAGPGFINIFLKNSYWSDLLIEILNEGADYGRSDIGKGLRVQVEFVSANPTGPLHIGHGRGAAVGDALVNILKFAGFEVTKEYYVNDVGKQVYNLGVSVELRAKELDGEKVELGEDHYKGDYIIDIARKYKESGSPKSAKDFAIDAMLEVIDTALKDFNVEFDIWFKESELDKDGRIMGAIDELRGKEKVYDKDGAVWLKTEELGDDKDRVLIKADGEKTYFASDIAYHRDKFERGFDRVVNIWG